MAFPTIPTTAAGRLLTTNQLNTTATRTFPAFSGLTYSDGDLLVGIVVAYNTSTGTDAAFSSWSNGFSERVDRATNGTLAIGIATKIASGSESGSLTVTQAGTITGDASLILMAIPGADASTAIEATAKADGTGSAADPASLGPSWGAEDTLWVSVVGSGCTNISGSWTGTGTTAPTNYGDRVDTNASDTSVVGDCEAAVAFWQNNASSENAGTAGVDTSNARNSALLFAVRPAAATPTSTAVGEVSLESGDAPATQTDHSLFLRARKASGSGTVTVSAALYEGANNRSGDLESSALTTSLATYELAIADANAANISSYSDLGVRFWADSSTGDTVDVEIAEIWLEAPGPDFTTHERSLQISAGSSLSAGAAERDLERSLALAAGAGIAISPQRDLERSVAIAAQAGFEAAAERTLERSIAISASAGLEISAVRLLERAVAIGAASALQIGAAQREIERSLALAAVAGLELGPAQRDLERALGLASTAGLQVGAALRELERAAAIAAASELQISGSVEGGGTVIERSAAFAASAGVELGSAQRDLERAIAITAISGLEISASAGSVLERSLSIEATSAVLLGDSLRLLDRAISLTGAAQVALGAPERTLERALQVGSSSALEIFASIVLIRSISFDVDSAIAINYSRPGWPGTSGEDWPGTSEANWTATAGSDWDGASDGEWQPTADIDWAT